MTILSSTPILFAAQGEEGGEKSFQLEVGHHTPQWNWFGMTVNGDTVIASAVAALIVIALAFVVKAKVTSGKPGWIQSFFEVIFVQMRSQVEGSIGHRISAFVLPLSVTLFVYILVANWLSVLPVQFGTTNDEGAPTAGEWLKPPASDVNFVYAMALFVFLAYHIAGFIERGVLTHLKLLAKGHGWGLAAINVIEEIAKPISLSLRLFGNMFAGGIMVGLIAMFPAWILWAPNAVWKSFDLFVGLIQAFIFALLTILYFSQSTAKEDAH
ncbi:F0F1 ATP synthase subunit A [Gordonia sp. TBRC 11910]|uniref:ATP synthase subunit a n=1 Tax=Gordonia asplenii TaxID=2725283 RepID=A0A848LBK3_9ACTN|nr:F0F1 ATP synthase subunit A [Gordonia asplenii]NMO04968.1 F0F1 ATP synthase subunit A [Gordonia asplenii]